MALKRGLHLVTAPDSKEPTVFMRFWDGKHWYRVGLDGRPTGGPDHYRRDSLSVITAWHNQTHRAYSAPTIEAKPGFIRSFINNFRF